MLDLCNSVFLSQVGIEYIISITAQSDQYGILS